MKEKGHSYSPSREVISGLAIVLIVLPIFSLLGAGIAREVISQGRGDGGLLVLMVLWGPYTPLTFGLYLFFFLCTGWFQILLTFLVVRRVKKYKQKGINASPLLWGLGTILPSIIVVLPLYLVRSHITWPKQVSHN